MDAEEFRRQGHALVDWIARYVEGVEDLPVTSGFAPGEIRGLLPEHPPAAPEPFEAVFADLDAVVVPGLTNWQHPMFFGYFPCNASYASILGELATAGLGVNGMLWATSPAATEVETLMLDWMAELLDLPDRFRSDTGPGGGAIQDTASSATLVALLAARERASGGTAARQGTDARLVAYTSTQAHSSVEKAARIAGLGTDRLRMVEVDEAHALRPDALRAAIAADRAAGLVPTCVVATVGTTSSMAIDPVAEIAAICAAEGVWLHVDAAMAGIAALCPERRAVNEGLDRADSYATNPHKWMGVNFDCNLFWVADRTWMLAALSVLPEYLRTAHTGQVIDYRDWQIPLGRRFRALKLWFTLRSEGVDAIQAMIRRHLDLTEELAAWLATDARFELVAPVSLDLVCFRRTAPTVAAADAATEALFQGVNATRRALLTRTVLDGRPAIRVCIGGRTTEARHVHALQALLDEVAGPAT